MSPGSTGEGAGESNSPEGVIGLERGDDGLQPPVGEHAEDGPGPPWPTAELVVGGSMGVVALIPMANAWTPSLPFDDAYISYTYALRLATGHGLTLSAGAKPVEAYSDPLWVFVLAIGKWLGFAIPTWSNILNLLLIAALAGTTMRLVRRFAPAAPLWTAAGAGVVIALLPAVAFYAVGDLETLPFTVLFNLTMLWFLSDAEHRRPLSAGTGILCVALALTRPEGALVWATAWALTWGWSRDARRQLKAAAWFLVPIGLFEVWRVAYFHQLLPNSVDDKIGLPLSTANFVPYWHHYYPALIVGFVCVVACLFSRRLPRALRPIAVVVVVTLAFEVAASSGDAYPYERYLFFVLPVLLAGSVAGLCRIGWPDARTGRSQETTNRRKVNELLSMSLVAVLLVATVLVALGSQEWQVAAGNDLNVRRGISQVGDLFRADTLAEHSGRYHFPLVALLNRTQPPGTTIAMDEIGVVSYYGNMHIIDLYGLADTYISHLGGVPGTRAAPDYVFSQHPRDIVLVTGQDNGRYTADERFLGYRLTNLLYDQDLGPVAMLFQRDADASSVKSLDQAIPIGLRHIDSIPPKLQFLLNFEEAFHRPGFDTAPPTPDVRAAAVLDRPTFTSIESGATVSIPITASVVGECTVHLTGLSPGSTVDQTLSARVKGPDGEALASTSTSFGTGPGVRTSLLNFSTNPHGPFALTVSGTSPAEWAEPFTTCR